MFALFPAKILTVIPSGRTKLFFLSKYLFFPTLAAVLQGTKPAEDFFEITDAFLETKALWEKDKMKQRNGLCV